MAEYLVKLRYYPEDPLVKMLEEDLKRIGNEYGVEIGYEQIDNRVLQDGLLMEETMDKPLEEITQEVITVSSNSEDAFRDCLIMLYQKYRCPRTVYSLVGSSEAGQRMARGLMNRYGGW